MSFFNGKRKIIEVGSVTKVIKSYQIFSNKLNKNYLPK